jgi:hypothetical protein
MLTTSSILNDGRYPSSGTSKIIGVDFQAKFVETNCRMLTVEIKKRRMAENKIQLINM